MPELAIISAADLAKCCQNEGAPLLLDVRTPVEFQSSNIAGSRLVPLDQLKAESLANELGKDVRCVVICAKGGRSSNAAKQLTAAGMTNLQVLEGGITAWESAGLPVQSNGTKVMSLDRQVRIAIGVIVLIGFAIGHWINANGYLLCAFMGAGLIFSGVTDFCGLALILAKAPWNRGSACGCGSKA